MGRHHRPRIISFNPAWCLIPPLLKDSAQRSSAGDNGVTPSNHPTSRSKTSHRHHHSTITITMEPSSPKVGCMGQIKKCKAMPSSLSRGRSVSSSSSSSSSSRSTPTSRGQGSFLRIKRDISERSSKVEEISVANLDPPLPVVKRGPPRDAGSASLWQRRCGVDGTQGFQLQLLSLDRVAAA